MRDTIKNYFLDKPGTFEDQEQSHVTLNLASAKVADIYQDRVEIKLTKNISKQLLKNIANVKDLDEEGEFQWSMIPIDKVSFNDLCDIIDESYESVIHTLPQDEQDEILDLEW